MVNFEIIDLVDIKKPDVHQSYDLPASLGDQAAHIWKLTVLNGGSAADLSGMTARADFLRADGVTVLVDGTIAGNVVSVTIPSEVYAVSGDVMASLRMIASGVIMTAVHARISVRKDATDIVVDGGTAIPNFAQLQADAIAATGDANDAADAANLAAERAGISVKGLYINLSALQSAHPTGAAGDGYLVGNTAVNTLYVWNPGTTEWVNAGPVGRYARSNQSVAAQTGFAADTYLDGSFVLFPGAPLVGTTYRLVFDVTKTAAGTATPIIIVRIGVAGTVSDAAILTFTFGAGTAAVDSGVFVVDVVFRTVGGTTTAVVQGIARLTSNLTTTGISNAVKARVATSAGFDSTVAALGIGASYNGGTSAAHTIQLVRAELLL